MFLFSRCVRILGKLENIRVVQLSLFQGIATAMKVAPTVEMKASDNPALENVEPDPTIFCTAFKKNRFYLVRWCDSFLHLPLLTWSHNLIMWNFSSSFLSENQRTQRAPTRTETSSTRSPQRRKWWQPRRPRGPRECLTAPSSTPPWATSTSSCSLSSESKTGMDVDPIVCVHTCKLWPLHLIVCFTDAPRLWRTSVSTAGTATTTATYFTESSRSILPSGVSMSQLVGLVTCSITVTIYTFSMLCAGLHDPDRRPHRHRHGRREHLGRGVWGRIPGHAETRPAVHSQHGQRRPRNQRLAVLHHCCTHRESFSSCETQLEVWPEAAFILLHLFITCKRRNPNKHSCKTDFAEPHVLC